MRESVSLTRELVGTFRENVARKRESPALIRATPEAFAKLRFALPGMSFSSARTPEASPKWLKPDMHADSRKREPLAADGNPQPTHLPTKIATMNGIGEYRQT
jgi:hypothetical protein